MLQVMLGVTLFFSSAATLYAQEITATPGTYELLESTTMQFDARANDKSGKVISYRWEIVSGKGGRLVNVNQPRVTFVAPAIDEKRRLFTVLLSLEYEKGKPSQARINIRVHKKNKETTKRRSSPWVSGTIGFGFGYLWGGWWGYPPLIVIPCPPPETIWPPEEIPPIAVPLPEDPDFDDWAARNPELVEAYLDDAGLTPEMLPGDEDLPAVDEPSPGDRQVPEEIAIEPVPELTTPDSMEAVPGAEPAPEIQPVPEPAPETMPMDTPMDMPMEMDIPFD